MADGWVSLRLLRECIRRLNRSYRALPPDVLRRWWGTLAGGLAAVFALTLAMVALGERLEAAGALAWERQVLRAFVDAAPVTFNTAMWMDAAGNGLVLWLGVLTFAALAAWHGYALRALTLLVGFTAAYLPFVAGWLLWERTRPMEVAAGIASPGGLHSFPSGHVVQAAVAFGILAHLWASAAPRRAEAVLAWTIASAGVAAVVVARLRLGAHWPTDVAGGAILGAAWLAVLVVALRRAEGPAPGLA
ncbi:MAG TPA: phosphatase PAP2 family protein [Longimicrobium sp.]|nr:phosphatase PAP2 family protein [Longimicrobium sp.]